MAYYQKYLKYKEKYLDLKNQIGGVKCDQCKVNEIKFLCPCKQASYCGKDCQALAWPSHKAYHKEIMASIAAAPSAAAPSAASPVCKYCGKNSRLFTFSELMKGKNPADYQAYPMIEQNTYKIFKKSTPHITWGLATCTAVQIDMENNLRFLAHLDDGTNIAPIIEELKKHNSFSNIKIWAGLGAPIGIGENPPEPFSISYTKATSIVTALGISLESVEISPTCFTEIVGNK
jgi:hypothetical protein